MIVLYHPEFARDIRRFTASYDDISSKLGVRFRHDLDSAIAAILASPTGAGHFIKTGSAIPQEVRRRNLGVFPFFVLYGLIDDRLIFA